MIVNPDSCFKSAADEVGRDLGLGPSVAQGYWKRRVTNRNGRLKHIWRTPERGLFCELATSDSSRMGELFVTSRSRI